MEQVTEYAVATKMRAELGRDFKMLSETASALEKKNWKFLKMNLDSHRYLFLALGR